MPEDYIYIEDNIIIEDKGPIDVFNTKTSKLRIF